MHEPQIPCQDLVREPERPHFLLRIRVPRDQLFQMPPALRTVLIYVIHETHSHRQLPMKEHFLGDL